MESFKMLLQCAKVLCRVRHRRLEESGGYFNVFSITGRERDEEHTHCRLMYELLKPDGSHGMGDVLLRSFFQTVLKWDYPDMPPNVEREYRFTEGEGGRIDLFIWGSDFCYPIEVKIDAGDQQRQVKRYANYARKRAKEWQVYYLTLDGKEPSEDSTGGEVGDEVTCISFAYDIIPWLSECQRLARGVTAVTEIIRQYECLLRKLTGNEEGEEIVELQKLIQSSRESFEGALMISRVLTRVNAEMLCKVFQEIEIHIGTKLKKIYADYKEKSNEFCSNGRKNSRYIGLYYLVAESKDFALSLGFEISSNEGLYYGLFYFKKNDGCYNLIPKTEKARKALMGEVGKRLKQVFPEKNWNIYNSNNTAYPDWPYTVWWEYLPRNNEIDFVNYNNACLALYDEEGYQNTMKQIKEEIDDCIEKLLKKMQETTT